MHTITNAYFNYIRHKSPFRTEDHVGVSQGQSEVKIAWQITLIAMQHDYQISKEEFLTNE